MKKIILILTVAAIAFTSCKTSKNTASAYQPAIENKKEVTVEKPEKVEVVEKKVATTPEAPIVVRSESLTVASGEDQAQGQFDFYVIIGSFAGSENAISFRNQLQSKGFAPVIMNNENGMFRVSVMQTNAETEARNLILEIRSKYEEYKDVWLLKRK